MAHSKTALSEIFQQKLTTIPVEEDLSALDAIKRCLPQIRRCRKRKINWDTIADLIKQSVQEAYSVEIRLSGITAKDYYYKLTRKKKSKQSQPRSRSTATTSRKSSTPANTMTSTQAVQPAVPAVTPIPEPVARSPAAEVEPEVAPVVNEPPLPDKEVSQPKRQKRSTRPSNSTFTRGYEGLNYL